MSVIVTAYNHERFIASAIESVLAQSFRDYELIVVDDGSSDGTADRILAFSRDVLTIRQENQGVAGSRNTGIRRATGKLLAFLDGDDLWEPDKLRLQVAAAEDHPGSGLVVGDGVKFSGTTIVSESLFPPELTALLAGRESLTVRAYEHLLRANLIATTSQVLIPRSALEDVGLSDTRFPISSDWDLYIRIAAAYDITFLQKRLIRWRYLETSASGPEDRRPLRWAADQIAILKKHCHSAPSQHRRLIRTLLVERIRETAEQTYWYGRQSDPAWARRHLLSLLRQNLSSFVLAIYTLAIWLPRPLVRVLSGTLRPLLKHRRLPPEPD